MSPELAGVVLAAGASSRMGRAKALLRHGDQPFLDHLGQALRAGGCRPVLAVVREPLVEFESQCSLEGMRLVVNPEPDRGQISSLRCALAEIPDAEALLVTLVDQGSILAETVAAVRKRMQPGSVTVACYRQEMGHPICFHRDWFAALASPLADEGARAVMAQAKVQGKLIQVEVEDAGVVRNLNTPADLQLFREQS